MEHNPSWETDSEQQAKNDSILLITMIHYRVHKSWPRGRILNQINPAYTLTWYLFKVHFNNILQTTLTYLTRSLPSQIPHDWDRTRAAAVGSQRPATNRLSYGMAWTLLLV
jgi:hypothetical protein